MNMMNSKLVTKTQVKSVCDLVQVSMVATIEKVLVGETFRILEAIGRGVDLKEEVTQNLFNENFFEEILKSFSFTDRETLEMKVLSHGKLFQDLLKVELEVALRRTLSKMIQQ